MVTLYFDTSAIVKRYHKEIGSDTLDKIFELKIGFATSFWTVIKWRGASIQPTATECGATTHPKICT